FGMCIHPRAGLAWDAIGERTILPSIGQNRHMRLVLYRPHTIISWNQMCNILVIRTLMAFVTLSYPLSNIVGTELHVSYPCCFFLYYLRRIALYGQLNSDALT